MRFRVSIAVIPLIMISMLFASSIMAHSQKPATNNNTVVFAVDKYETGDTIIEPIFILKGKTLLKPPTGEESDAASDKFTASYFKSGTKYRMLSGGGEAGWITIKERLEPGCVDLQASVIANTIAEIGGEVMALATNAESLGLKESARRAASEEERSAIVKIAQRLFRQKGVMASLIKEMKAANISAFDLNRDGLFELVGTFEINKGESGYSLFIITEPEGVGYRTAFNWYYKFVNEAEYEKEQIVDVIDLDSDGIMEVIARHFFYESHEYIVYKKQKGLWRNIYRGAGGGC